MTFSLFSMMASSVSPVPKKQKTVDTRQQQNGRQDDARSTEGEFSFSSSPSLDQL